MRIHIQGFPGITWEVQLGLTFGTCLIIPYTSVAFDITNVSVKSSFECLKISMILDKSSSELLQVVCIIYMDECYYFLHAYQGMHM